MRQPASESSHRSPHEGLEARVGVWGDAAGTAPAVTSVRASAFDLSLNFQELFNVATLARLTGAFYFWIAFFFVEAEHSDSSHETIDLIQKFVRYSKN